MRRILPPLTALVLAEIGAGCAGGGTVLRFEEARLGFSVKGRPIEALVITGEAPPRGAADPALPAAEPEETLLLFAAIHGDEPLGPPLLERLIEELRGDPDLARGKVLLFVPIANPDGLALRSRGNAGGVDLNRNFPARNWRARGDRHGFASESEPESRALAGAIEAMRPARILSVHSPLHCINYDGPARELARAMASACGYPLRESIGYPTPGSFGSWAGGDLGIPVITLELREGGAAESHWEELRPALLEFIRFRAASHADGRGFCARAP